MQKKIDKEYLIKNRFWVSLPFIALFLLIGFFCVIGVRSEAEANFNKAKGMNDKLEKIKRDQDLRNEAWLKRIGEERDAAHAQMLRVWRQEFDRQNGVVRDAEGRHMRDPLITWPKSVENIPVGKDRRPLKDHDFGEPVGTNDPYFNQLPAEYEAAYRDQFDDIRKMLDLLDEKAGTGAVRVLGKHNSNWDNALDLLNPHTLVSNKRVLSDEAWLLQEDVAIKRELAKAVTKANDLVANLQPEWRLITALPEQLKAPATGAEAAAGVMPPAGQSTNPAAAAIAPSATGPGSSGEKTPDKTDEAKKEKKESVDRQHFLNTTWQLGLVERTYDKEGKVADEGPSTAWWEGWLLDLELIKIDDNTFRLEGLVANLGNKRQTPAAKLAVSLYDEFAANKTFVVALDLPELPASPADATQTIYAEQQKGALDFNTLAATKISKQPLKMDLKGKLPDKFHPRKITLVRRAPGGQAPKAGDNLRVIDHQRFANDFWVMDIQLVSAPGLNRGLRGVLYNRSGMRLTPPTFNVLVRGEDFEFAQEVPIWGDKLNALNSGGPAEAHRDQRVFPRPGATPVEIKRTLQYNEIASVRQVLDWQTVPIKRIDRLELGYEAERENDRVKVVPLKKYEFGKKSTLPAPPEAAAEGPASGGSAGPGGGGAMGMSGMGQSGGASAGMGQRKEGSTANHQVAQYRFYENETEVRRVPVALVMIVDANHIADVLTSFANTRLRVQVQQAVWTRLPQGIGRPNLPSDTEAGAKSGDSSKKAPPNIPAANKPIDDDTLQVELQIYGMATIYEDPDAHERIAKEKSAAPAK